MAERQEDWQDPVALKSLVCKLNMTLRDDSAVADHVCIHNLAALAFRATEQLIVYGSLAPGGPNHGRLRRLKGAWIEGWIRGKLISTGWGSALGYPALWWQSDGALIEAWLLQSPALVDHWTELDAFEGAEYRRILAPFYNAEQEIIAIGYLYESGGRG